MKYLWPLQGFLECTTRGNERSYALKFTLASMCQHHSHVEPHKPKSVGSSDGGLATNVSSRSSVASHAEKGKTGSQRRPGRPRKNPDGPSTTSEAHPVAFPKRRDRERPRRKKR